MKLTLLQLPARYGDTQAQLRDARALLTRAPPGELVLLPEASLTGYLSPEGDFDLSRFAEPLDGSTAQSLSTLSQEFECTLIGPLIERAGDECFNAMVGFDARGVRVLHYRKRHPWYPEQWATPGELPYLQSELPGVSCAICFDLHFLSAELPPTQLLLFASAWVEDGPDTRIPLLQALARDRGLAIANANWGAGEPRVPGQGGSCVIDRAGQLIARAGAWLERLDCEL